ncbi:hypothetical protein ADL29_07740 [Streptomyces chattanoogensis]|uniref:Uncharacterized protein n=1 Tax=Streptomyces chattanoogensis TaxID=66876 RepID=A0A0N0XXX0_9ACTN|nr:hypothetical protein ADL29_07740 [Streptomyces chattanoogensis]
MARMVRRLPLSLRTWSGALLVCALFVCLSGMTRPLTAMPEPMEMASPAAEAAMAAGHPAPAPAPAVHGSPDHAPDCPMVDQRCGTLKATLAQDGPTGQVPVPANASDAMTCSPALLVARPHAPPHMAPPDLQRLCVSRT